MKKLLTLLMATILMLAMATTALAASGDSDFTITGGEYDTNYTETDDTLTITAAGEYTITAAGEYTITATGETPDNIVIDSTVADDVTLNLNSVYMTGNITIDPQMKGNVTINLNGTTIASTSSSAISFINYSTDTITAGIKSLTVNAIGDTASSITGATTGIYSTYSGYGVPLTVGGTANLSINADGGEDVNSRGVFSVSDITFNNTGEISITSSNVTSSGNTTVYDSYGIYSNGNTVTFNGTGKVTLKSGSSTEFSTGVRGGTVIIGKNATVDTTGGSGESGSYGVYATYGTSDGSGYHYDALIVNGKLTASGKSWGVKADGFTIEEDGSLTANSISDSSSDSKSYIKGGTVKVKSTDGAAIYTVGDLTISGGTVKVESKDGAAINTWGDLTISGGTIEAEGTTYGIYSGGAMSIENAKITGTAKTTAASSSTIDIDAVGDDEVYGIYASKGLTISGTDSDTYITSTATSTSASDDVYAIGYQGTLSVSDDLSKYANTGTGYDQDVVTYEYSTGYYTYVLDDGNDTIVTDILIGAEPVVVTTNPSSSSVKTYTNTLEVGDGGDAIATPMSAKSGITVWITPTADEGYEIDEVIVDDGDVTVTDAGDGTYSFTQPARKVTIEVTFTYVGDEVEEEEVEEEVEETETGFDDVDADDWYADAVETVVDAGIMNGTGDNKFEPNASTTRGMIVTMLWRVADEPVVNYLMTFEDVDPDVWYGEAVRWASSEQIVLGFSDEEFAPNQNITREQVAAILYRYMDAMGEDVSAAADLSTFTDYTSISDYAADAMAWAVANGYINGYEDGTLAPTADITRAEIATIFARFLAE